MVSSCAIGKNNRMVPSSASFKCKAVFISGMRLAQLAKQMPWQKKKADSAKRICHLLNGVESVVSFVNNQTIIHEGNLKKGIGIY